MSFWKATKGLYICDLYSKIFRVFQNLIVLSSQKQIIDQILANQLKILLRTSYCIFFSKREKNICTFFKDLLRSRGYLSLKLWVSWTQGKGIPRVFRSCKKNFYKVSENLKWVAWGLNVGTESGRTSINWVCKFSLSISHLHYCNLILSCAFKEHRLNWFFASSAY